MINQKRTARKKRQGHEHNSKFLLCELSAAASSDTEDLQDNRTVNADIARSTRADDARDESRKDVDVHIASKSTRSTHRQPTHIPNKALFCPQLQPQISYTPLPAA